jgi:hypothetical protein
MTLYLTPLFFRFIFRLLVPKKLEFIQWNSAALGLNLFFAHAHYSQANVLHYFKVHTLRGSYRHFHELLSY